MQPSGRGQRRKDLRRTRRGIKTGRRATHPVETTYGRGQERRDHELRWAAQAWLPGFRAAVPATVTVLITDAAGNTAELVINPAEPMTACPNSLVKGTERTTVNDEPYDEPQDAGADTLRELREPA